MFLHLDRRDCFGEKYCMNNDDAASLQAPVLTPQQATLTRGEALFRLYQEIFVEGEATVLHQDRR